MEQLTVFQERDVHQPRVRRVEDRAVLGELSSVRNEKEDTAVTIKVRDGQWS